MIPAIKSSTENTIQKTLRSTWIFYGVRRVGWTDESRGTAGAGGRRLLCGVPPYNPMFSVIQGFKSLPQRKEIYREQAEGRAV